MTFCTAMVHLKANFSLFHRLQGTIHYEVIYIYRNTILETSVDRWAPSIGGPWDHNKKSPAWRRTSTLRAGLHVEEKYEYKGTSLSWDRGVPMASKGRQYAFCFLAVRQPRLNSDRALQTDHGNVQASKWDVTGSTPHHVTFFLFSFSSQFSATER